MLHDCFGTIIREKRKGVFEFLCDDCGRPYASMSVKGLKVKSKHGSKNDSNSVPLRALKVLIKEIESAQK
jgi:hypothetical protein